MIRRYLAVLVTGLLGAGALAAGPAAAQPPVERPTIEISAAFDKPSYQTGDTIRFTFTVTNVGAVRAAGLRVAHSIIQPTDIQVNEPAGWGALDTRRPGVTLEPGETVEVPVAGSIRDLELDAVTVRGFVFDETNFSVINGQFNFSVPVAKGPGHAAGTLFGDANGNGTFDNGEELSGIPLTLSYVNNFANRYTATTDESGRFSFPQIPTARYFIGGEVLDGWLVPFDIITVDGSPGPDNLLVRGAPPLNGALQASVAFTRDSYRPGELAHVTVTLRNSGPIPLTGIFAACNRAGSSNSLNGDGPGWGDLEFSAGGVTIAPGQTRTFDVTEIVPESAINFGYVNVACDFGYREVDIDNHANAFDRADVPGGVAEVRGDAMHFPNGDQQPGVGVAGVWIILVNARNHPVGVAVTDENGHFEMTGLAPGPDHQAFFIPPRGWRIPAGYSSPVLVQGGGSPAELRIVLEPRQRSS